MNGHRLGILGAGFEVGVGIIPFPVGGLIPGSLGKPGRSGKGDGLLPRSSISFFAGVSSFIEKKL